jgi:hypothetical protein
MDRYLRGLAIGTLVFAAVLIAFTFPEFHERPDAFLQGVSYAAFMMTGTLLTSATGMLGLVLGAQRRQRPWAVAFFLLLLLSTFSPLLYYAVVI